MTAIDSAEVIHELESECECAREVLAAMQEQRDRARDCAAALEAELAQAERLLGDALSWAMYADFYKAQGDHGPWGEIENFLRWIEAEAIAAQRTGGEG